MEKWRNCSHNARVDRVALLQEHELVPGGLAHRLVGLRLGLDFLVERFEMAERVELQLVRVALAFVAEQDHAEAGAPVAEVIVGDDLVAEERVEARQRVAQDGAAQMAHVHFLRDVRAAVVEHDCLGMRRDGHAEPPVLPPVHHLPVQVGGREPEIEEARAGDFRRFRDAVEIERGAQLLRHLARIALRDLGRAPARRWSGNRRGAGRGTGARRAPGGGGWKSCATARATRASSSWRGVFTGGERVCRPSGRDLSDTFAPGHERCCHESSGGVPCAA